MGLISIGSHHIFICGGRFVRFHVWCTWGSWAYHVPKRLSRQLPANITATATTTTPATAAINTASAAAASRDLK